MTSSPSIARRAVLAIALMIGFYLLALATALGLNAIPLSGLTPEALPQCTADLKGFGKRCSNHAGEQPDDDHAEGLACAVAGAALALALVNKGGKPEAIPGKDVSVTVGSIEFELFGVLRSLAERKLTAEEWQQRCSQLGIQGTDLGNVATGKE